jgi:hypothetical protein
MSRFVPVDRDTADLLPPSVDEWLAEQAAALRRAQDLARLTPQAQRMELLRQQCQELDARITDGTFKKHAYSAGSPGPLYQQAVSLVKQSLEDVPVGRPPTNKHWPTCWNCGCPRSWLHGLPKSNVKTQAVAARGLA